MFTNFFPNFRTMKTTTTFVAAKLMAFIAVAFANTYVIGDSSIYQLWFSILSLKFV